jgi:hypothetical protein
MEKTIISYRALNWNHQKKTFSGFRLELSQGNTTYVVRVDSLLLNKKFFSSSTKLEGKGLKNDRGSI